MPSARFAVRALLSGAVACAAVACAKGVQPAAASGLRATDEATIRGLDSAWAKAMAAKNVDQITSYYADRASLMAPGDSLVSGKGPIQKTYTAFVAMPGFALTFHPTRVDVSGDLAYEVGDYALTLNDKSGRPQTTNAKYVVVWGKQADGTWKVLVDAPTTTL